MISMETNYLGLTLKNPIIIGSCGLTNSYEKIKEFDNMGAGAVVLKSLIEEQINLEAGSMIQEQSHSEADDYILSYTKSKTIDDYISLIEKCKKNITIPIIASINCISSSDWVQFAKRIEDAGADALELNLFYLPMDKNAKAEDFENIYFELVSKIKKDIKIPISIKLSPYFTNVLNMVNRLHNADVKGVVLFNRFYEPDIDIERMEFRSAEVFTSANAIRQSLRWVGIISSKINNIDIASSTGVHSGEAAIKMLLAGATVVQAASVFYKNGAVYVEKMLKDMESWMRRHNYKNIQEFRGKMSYNQFDDASYYERSQFIRYFASID